MRTFLAIITLIVLSTCVVSDTDVSTIEVTGSEPITVTSPVAVHLNDGSSVYFADGISVSDNTVYGNGILSNSTGEQAREITELSLDDVAAMESHQETTNVVATTFASIAAGLLIGVAVAALAVALFGSCPTVYSLAADVPILETELFSYNIAPAFQSRDVDRLSISSPVDGRISLDIRNEMLETHYIDQLELIEISHGPDEKVYPGRNGRPIAASEFVAPVSAVDQDDNDILRSIQYVDNVAWSASDERLARVNETDYTDHLYLEFEVPEGTEDTAIVLRMRNSMLNTVLFYDIMLKEQSFGALDWVGKDLNRFTNTMKTGLWFRENMGLGIEVWDNGRYRDAGRIVDQGPIAWAERALQLPDVEPDQGKLKVRLSFVADNWRFDQVSLALNTTRPKNRIVPVEVAETQEGPRPSFPDYLARSDKEYLITRPGDSVQIHFDVGAHNEGQERTFFLASDGYYIEWMRADWLTQEHRATFKPGNDAILRALDLYAAKRDGYRELFESTAIPVR